MYAKLWTQAAKFLALLKTGMIAAVTHPIGVMKELIIGMGGVFIKTFAVIKTAAIATFSGMERVAIIAFNAIKTAATVTGAHVAFALAHPQMAITGAIAGIKSLGSKIAISTPILSIGKTVAKTALFARTIWTVISSLSALKAAILILASAGVTVTAPLWAIVAAISAVVIGVFALIIRNWEKVKRVFSSGWGFIKSLFGFIATTFKFIAFSIDKIVPQIGDALRAVGGFFVGLWNGLKGIGGWIEKVFVGLLDWLINTFETLTNILDGLSNVMKSIMGKPKELEILDQSNVGAKAQTDDSVFEGKKVKSADTGKGSPSTPFSQASGPSIQFVNFAGLKDVQVTLESGFQSLVNVNSKILDVISGGEGEIKVNKANRTITSPSNANIPEVGQNSQGQDGNIQNITINIDNAGNIDVDALTNKIKEELLNEMKQNQFGQ